MSPTATARPGRPRDEAIDAAIREAALQELEDRGFLAMTIEGVAQRAGVARTTVYRRWPGTQELAVDAMRGLFVETRVPPDGSGEQQVRWLVQRIRHTWADARYAAIMRRIAADGTRDPRVYREARDELIRPGVEQLDVALRRCVDDGTVAADVDLELARRLLVAPIVAAGMTLRGALTVAQTDRIVDTVLRGLAP